MQTFSAAIFDMDGLLIDSERVIMHAWMAVAQDLGVNISRVEYLHIVGKASRECHEILSGLLGGEDVFRQALMLVREKLSALSCIPLFPLKPGAQALLNVLNHAGIPCAVASSSTVEEIRSRLEKVNLRGFFQTIVGGDEVIYGKPHPAVYLLAAERLRKSPAECLAFEDSENGARAANGAGIHVVTVPDLKPATAEVIDFSFCVLESLDEAIELAGDWFSIPKRSH